MKVYIPGSCFLLLFLQVTVAAETCEKNWWGPKCQLRCFCKKNVGCNSEGVCDDNKCLEHFYGPSCQYEDALAWDKSKETQNKAPYVFDFDDQTCNTDASATVVEVQVDKKVTFTWYRIVVNNPNVIRNFTTTFNNGKQCWNERKFVVDNKTVDVSCDIDVFLKVITITGAIAPSVCDIYISLGRNVGLKQKTFQSSDYEKDQKKCGAANAVDYITPGKYEDGHCAQTGIEESGPEWNLELKEPTRLNLINIFTENDGKHRFHGLTVTIYDELKILAKTYTAVDEQGSFYQFLINTHKTISYVQIKQSPTLVPLMDRYLTLCEVKVLGDAECPNSKFGILCETACTCQPHEACNYLTGACVTGCEIGYYGFNCSKHCAIHCPNRTCNAYTGHCQPCTGGFVGSRCEIECDPGTYGDDKICRKCSPGCIEICNILNGSCSCKSGFEGERCQNCKLGTYFLENMCVNCHYGCDVTCDNVTGYCNVCKDGFTGLRCSDCAGDSIRVNCNFNCSKGCHHKCNIVDGLCSCDIDFKGPLCSECETSYYGTRCDLNCPEHCVNKICFRANGTCPACEGGFSGIKCDDSGIMPFEWILAMLFVADAIIVLCCLFLCRTFGKKKHSLTDDEE